MVLSYCFGKVVPGYVPPVAGKLPEAVKALSSIVASVPAELGNSSV